MTTRSPTDDASDGEGGDVFPPALDSGARATDALLPRPLLKGGGEPPSSCAKQLDKELGTGESEVEHDDGAKGKKLALEIGLRPADRNKFGPQHDPQGTGANNRLLHHALGNDEWLPLLRPIADGQEPTMLKALVGEDCLVRIATFDADDRRIISEPMKLEREDFLTLASLLDLDEAKAAAYLERRPANFFSTLYSVRHPDATDTVAMATAVATSLRSLAYGRNCDKEGSQGGVVTMLLHEDEVTVSGTMVGLTLRLLDEQRTRVLAGLRRKSERFLASADEAEDQRESGHAARQQNEGVPLLQGLLQKLKQQLQPQETCAKSGCTFPWNHGGAHSGAWQGCTKDPECTASLVQPSGLHRCTIPCGVKRRRAADEEAAAAAERLTAAAGQQTSTSSAAETEAMLLPEAGKRPRRGGA